MQLDIYDSNETHKEYFNLLDHMVSGTPTSGVYEVTFTVPHRNAPGDWRPYVSLEDLSGVGQDYGEIFEEQPFPALPIRL